MYSLVEDGPRGLEELAPEDVATYGIDWEAAEDEVLMAHHLAENADQLQDDNPFIVGPAMLSHVECEPPSCPLTDVKVQDLGQQLALQHDLSSTNMIMRRLVWQSALQICMDLIAV